MIRGRPFQPGNKLGRGRPKGALNKLKQAKDLFSQHAPALMALGLNAASKDPQMLRMFVNYILRQQADQAISLGKLPTKTMADVDHLSEVALAKATAGKLPLEKAEQLMKMAEQRRIILETRDLDRRLAALENPSAKTIPNTSEPDNSVARKS